MCNPWNHRDPFGFAQLFSIAGGPSMYCARWSNEAATVHADIWPDQPDVPARRETYVKLKLFHFCVLQ